MKKNNDKRFDILLSRAHEDEDALVNLLLAKGDKLELKTEYKYWKKSGCICIEIESYGKPSGVTSTEASHWVHSLKDEKTGRTFYMIIEVEQLRELIKPYVERGETIRAGDNWASVCVIVPLSVLLDHVRGITNEETPSTKAKAKAKTTPQTPQQGSKGTTNGKVPPKSNPRQAPKV